MEKHHFTFSAFIPLLICGVIAIILAANGVSFFLILGLVFVGLIITLIINGNQNMKIQMDNLTKMEDALKTIPDFEPTRTVTAYGNAYVFSIDDRRNKVVLIENNMNQHVFSYKDLLDCEIVVDNETIFRKSAMRTANGVFQSSATHKPKVKKLFLNIKVQNLMSPTISLTCFDAWEASARTAQDIPWDDFRFQDALSAANEVSDIISVIIDRNNEKTEIKKPEQSAPAPSDDMIERLEKLHSLKEKGILTEEEFQAQKTKILHS